MKKKYVGLALFLGTLVSMSRVSQAGEWKGGTIYAGDTVGDGYEVSTDYNLEANGLVGHAFGIYTQTLDSNVVTRAGDNLKIEIWGAGTDGVRTNYANGSSSNLPKSSGQIYIGNDLILNTYGRSSDAFNINGSAYVEIGKNATLQTFYDGDLGSHEGAHGLRLNHNGTIKVDDDLTIITQGKASHGLYGIGNTGINFDIKNKSHITTHGENSNVAYISGRGAKLEVGTDAIWKTNGINSHAISVIGDKVDVTIGSRATLETKESNSHAVNLTGGNGEFTIGSGGTIVTNGNDSYGLTAIGYLKSSSKNGAAATESTQGENNKITLGDGSTISTKGNNSHGVYMAGRDGLISLGSDMTIQTSGDGAHGLYGHGELTTSTTTVGSDTTITNTTYGDNGKIEVGAGLDLKTTGLGSHGIYTDWATTSVELKGGAKIGAQGSDSYAIYAKSGTITSKLDGSGNVSNLDGGNFQIFGDMKTDAGGKIDMRLGNGSLFVGSADQGAGNINLVLQDGSKWYVTKDKNADVTIETGGELFLGEPINWSKNHYAWSNDGILTVNGGTIHFLTDISSVTSDFIRVNHQIQGTSGILKVSALGSAKTNGTEEVVLIDGEQGAVNGSNTFALENGSVDQGGYSYTLESRASSTSTTGTEWFLRGSGQASETGSSGVNVFSGAYLLNYAETQTLLQRLGDLRQGDSEGDLWARAYGGKFTSASDGFLSGYEMTYSGLQVGVDRKKELANRRGEIYYGGFAGYGKGSLDYGRGSGSVDTKTLGIYGTYISPKGFYTDLVVKHVWMKNDFSTLDSSGDKVTGGNMNTNGISASIEVGKGYHFGRKKKEGWYVEPQAQLTTSRQSGGSFKASNGLRIDVESSTSILSRVGANVGYEIKEGKNPVNGYFKFSHVREFNGDVDYRLNDSKETTSYSDSWWTWGLGVTAQVNNKHHIYIDVERASGGQFNQPWALNGGYRFTW